LNNSIADYFATLSFRPDVASLRNVDRFLRIIERKIERYQRRGGPLNLLNLNNIRNRNGGNGGGNTRTPTHTPTIRQVTTGGMPNVGQLAGAGVAGFGLGSLNDTLQKLEMLPVALEAVTGSAEKAAEQLDFITKLGHQIGATRLELAPEYTKMLSSAIGTSLESEMPRIFTALTQYGKIMGLDKNEMHGSFKAVGQMINKQQIMAEELKGQLAERLPAAIRIMADAMTNGDTKALFAMMQAGKLDPTIALPRFATKLEERAAGGMEKYQKTQRAQQNFTRVALEDQIVNFGKAGGNEGFFRVWKTFAKTLQGMSGLVRGLAGAFKALVGGIEVVGTTIQFVSNIFDIFYKLPSEIQTVGNTFALMAGAMMVKASLLGKALGKAFWPLTAALLAIEDIYLGLSGVDSLTKRAMDLLGNSNKSGEGVWKRPALNIPTSKDKATPFLRRSLDGMGEAGFGFDAKLAYLLQGFVPAEHNPTAYLPKSSLDNNYNLNINVSGATEFDQKLADEISRQTSAALRPLVFAKEIGE
jgi:tape measure domain-containing protein